MSTPTAAAPAEQERVRAAFRLGWAVAELRGRYRPDLFLHPEPEEPAGFRRLGDEHPLPLGMERKNREIRIEVIKAAEGLSKALGLAIEIRGKDAFQRLIAGTAALENTNDTVRRQHWPALTQTFYSWDAHLQDALVVQGSEAAAYQLGRALAETYWALTPGRSELDMGSWGFVFGASRQETVERLLARLATSVTPLVQSAVRSSFHAWSLLAADVDRRSAPGVPRRLFEQGLLWRDLIRGERDPLHLAPPATGDPWRQVSVYTRAATALRAPLTIGAVFAVLLILGGALLASGAKYTGLSTVVTLAGALGLTSAGLYARAKAQVTSLMSELRLKVDEQRVASAASLCPPAAAQNDV